MIRRNNFYAPAPHGQFPRPVPPIASAQRFKSSSIGEDVVQEYVRDSLRVIEDDIRTAVENEKTSSRTELPSFFDIPGMTRNRAQKHVYYHVLRSLRQAGYIPSITLTPNGVYLDVTWYTKEDVQMENHMENYIRSHQAQKPSPLPEENEPPRPVRRRRRKFHLERGSS